MILIRVRTDDVAKEPQTVLDLPTSQGQKAELT